MPWSNPDYEPDPPRFDPEPIDDDPWDVPEYPPDTIPEATEDDLSDEDPKDDL